MAVPMSLDIVDEEIGICSSNPFRQKTTLHYAERKAKLFDNWIKRQLMLESLLCEMYCQYLQK